jgi:hypothetical protein
MKIRVTISHIRSCSTMEPLSLSDLSYPQEGGKSTNHQQLPYQCKLNLVMFPHRVRSLDLTGQLIDSAATQPVSVPVPISPPKLLVNISSLINYMLKGILCNVIKVLPSKKLDVHIGHEGSLPCS